ncbi:MAG: CpsD/CapB family tyrosine-protein kinase, partial [Armatimonadota bacterium]|nr:CpsD/CapB family tyrosine-protein kinase [Armatimonadota bacterium]
TAKPGQGATTTICNLAVALAQVGKNVILIDADLRRPHLHDYFGVSNDKGLTSLLQGECEMGEALKHTDIDKLVLLPSGPLPLNPAELLASPQMRSLHERLKPHTDFILIDTPSAIAFSDSAILASFMDAVLLVMRAQEAPRGGEGRVKELLTKARANVVGVVLNGVKPELVDSAYYHSAYYPQITTTLPNAGALPPPVENAPLGLNAPANGQPPLRDGYEQTLMGVRLNHSHLHQSAPDGSPKEANGKEANGHAPAREAIAVNPDGPAESTSQVKRPDDDKPQRARFSLRSVFGTDEPDER